MWTTKENTRKELERVIRTEEDTKRRSVRRTGTKIRSDAKHGDTREQNEHKRQQTSRELAERMGDVVHNSRDE